MFTGIVEQIGSIEHIAQRPSGEMRARIRGPLVASDAEVGDSIAVDGVCLTVIGLDGDNDQDFIVEIIPETLRCTTLGSLAPGSPVNLERSIRPTSRLGGHIVQGHVDGVGTVVSRSIGGPWRDLVINVPGELSRFIAHKGAVTVNGVSLTVTEVTASTFGVSLIPETCRVTTLGQLDVGDHVNIEIDVHARYVDRLINHAGTDAGLTSETRAEAPVSGPSESETTTTLLPLRAQVLQ